MGAGEGGEGHVRSAGLHRGTCSRQWYHSSRYAFLSSRSSFLQIERFGGQDSVLMMVLMYIMMMTRVILLMMMACPCDLSM